MPAEKHGAAHPWRRIALLILAGLVLAGFVALNIALLLTRMDNDDVEHARTAAVASAKQRIPAMLSYDYRQIDVYVSEAPDNTTGSFKADFTQLVTGVIAPAARTQQITTKATAKAVGIVDAHADRVVVLVLLNQVTTSKDSTTGRVDGSRVKATMRKVGDDWLVEQLAQV